jgi:hypothetical protein
MEDIKKNIIDLQETYNISLYPLKQITKDRNKKTDYQDPKILYDFWKNADIRFSTDYILRQINNNNVCGFAIATGYKNNIVVIDYDNKETTNKDFLNMLFDADTLTISTPSGGYHFLFKYTDLLKKNARGIFNNVDIRGNRGIIFHGLREDGIYNISNNKPIKKIKDNIINLLTNNINGSHIDKPTQTTTNKDKQRQTKTIIKKYDVSKDEIFELLELLPTDYLDEYNEWLKITYILWGMNEYDIWDKWSRKSKKYNEKKNKEIWEHLKNDDIYNNDFLYLIWLVKFHNKDINIRNIERIYKEYIPTNEEYLKSSKTINKQYLTIYDIDNTYKINLIQSSTGTGKTTNAINYTKIEQEKNPNIKILSITHLKTIADDHYKRFNEKKIKIDHYKNINNGFYDNNDYSGLVIVINSIIKLKNIDFSNYIIYLDEITALFDTLLNSPTIKHRKEVLITFIKILNECHLIIGTDGIINDISYSFMSQALPEEKINFVINTYQNFKDKPAYFIEDYKHIENKIIDDLNNNSVFICCFNTKRHTDRIEALILKENPEYKEQILKYTSTHGEEIKDIKEEWENKIILYSPSIVQGIDYNPKDALNIYCFIFGENTINPIQSSQQIARNRNPLNTYIYIEGCKNKITFKNGINEIKKYYKEIDTTQTNIFNDLIDTQTTFKGVEYFDNPFTELFYKYRNDDDILRSSYKYHLKTILKNKGYNIIDELIYDKISINKKEEKQKKQELTDIINNKNTELFEKYLNNELSPTDKYKTDLDKKIELLDLNIKADKEIITLHKDILIDNINFSLFFNVIYYLCNNKISSIKKIQDRNNEDYTYQTIKEPQILMNTYKRLILTYTPEINPYYFAYDESKINNDIINMTDEDYKMLKSITKTTRQKPNNKIELLRLIYLLAKKIYGGNVKRKAFSRREGKKNNNYSIILFNDAYLYLCLKRIDPNNPRLCPYIEALINNDDFRNIDINNILEGTKINDNDNEDETDGESVSSYNSKQETIYILPYKKIDINILKNDIINH